MPSFARKGKDKKKPASGSKDALATGDTSK